MRETFIDTARFTPEERQFIALAEELTREGDLLLDLTEGQETNIRAIADQLSLPPDLPLKEIITRAMILHNQVYQPEDF